MAQVPTLPPLTEVEYRQLKASIRRDGVQYPVLLDRVGKVIDGTQRQRACGELGIECPTRQLDVSDGGAARLRVVLNIFRRQVNLDPVTEAEGIAWLAKQYQAEEQAAAKWLLGSPRPATRKGDRKAPTITGFAVTHDGSVRELIAERIAEDLQTAGRATATSSSPALSPASMQRALKLAKVPAGVKAAVRSGTMTKTEAIGQSKASLAPKRSTPVAPPPVVAPPVAPPPVVPVAPPKVATLASIRASDYENQYLSMLNCPPRSLNLPLIRRADEVQLALAELAGLDPAVAVEQIPIEKCRYFTEKHALWWSEFTALCEKRRMNETPDVPPVEHRRHPNTNPVVRGADPTPAGERALSFAETAVLDWMRRQSHPVSMVEAAVATRKSKDTTTKILQKLITAGLVTRSRAGVLFLYEPVDRTDRA